MSRRAVICALVALLSVVPNYPCALIPDYQTSGNNNPSSSYDHSKDRRLTQVAEGMRGMYRNARDEMRDKRDRMMDRTMDRMMNRKPMMALPPMMRTMDLSKMMHPLDLNGMMRSMDMSRLSKSGGEMIQRLMNQDGFMIDMSTMKLNPSTDWGFRVGNWYMIRRPSTESNSIVADGDNEGWRDWDDFMDSLEDNFAKKANVFPLIVSDMEAEAEN